VLVIPAEGPHRGSESWEIAAGDEPHIDHVTTDLAAFLEAVGGTAPSRIPVGSPKTEGPARGRARDWR
jgi:hypothetical protein